MPLKIRCPHCERVLTAEDDAVGQTRDCPACGEGFTVPMPIQDDVSHTTVGTQCPSCGATVAPGTKLCRACLTDLGTGERLPWKQRLRYVSLGAWSCVAFGLIAASVLAVIGLNVYRNRAPQRVATQAPTPVARSVESEDPALADALLGAGNAEDRTAAIDAFKRRDPRELVALAASLKKAPLSFDPRNVRAAIELLAATGEDRWLPLVRELASNAALRAATLHARGMLGDAEAALELGEVWGERARRSLFTARLLQLVPSTIERINQIAPPRAAARAEKTANVLRHLAESYPDAALDPLLERYWSSWQWLGQVRGEAFAAAWFELAKPPRDADVPFPEQIRSARRVLEAIAKDGSAAACAAAGAVLHQCAPYYSSLGQRIAARLATLAPESAAPDQQRIIWTLAQVAGRTFQDVAPGAHPLDYGRDSVRDALAWARTSALAQPARLRTRSRAYPEPPALRRRVVTSHRQIAMELLRDFERGWPGLESAVDRWLDAELGWTAKLDVLIAAGQREPRYPALAATMILAAELDQQSVRPQLLLWRSASDQPAWLRGLAGTTLAALQSRAGTDPDRWPTDLRADMFASVGQKRPAWSVWGRVLAAGGTRITQRLSPKHAGALPASLRARLLSAAEQASERRSLQSKP